MKRILLCLIITIIAVSMSACGIDEDPLTSELTMPLATESPLVVDPPQTSPSIPDWMPNLPTSTPKPTPYPAYDNDLASNIYRETMKYFDEYESDPNKKPLEIEWPQIGVYRYYEEGFDVSFVSMDDYPVWGNYLHFSPECKLKLPKGIGIGSTRSELYTAYEGAIDFENSSDEIINAATGIWFVMKNDIIVSIYIDTGYVDWEYWEFFPDRDWGFPLDVVEINVESLDMPGMFYLGEPKEEVMSLIAEKRVNWKEYSKDDGGCVVSGDRFLFEFDENRNLTTVAADHKIAPRTWGTGRWPYPYGTAYYYDDIKNEYSSCVETTHTEAELLPNSNWGYTKLTVDMGTHYYFVCYRSKTGDKTREPFRWGITVKE